MENVELVISNAVHYAVGHAACHRLNDAVQNAVSVMSYGCGSYHRAVVQKILETFQECYE